MNQKFVCFKVTFLLNIVHNPDYKASTKSTIPNEQSESYTPIRIIIMIIPNHNNPIYTTVKPRIVRTIRSRNSAHNWGAHNECFKKLRRFSLSVTDSYV